MSSALPGVRCWLPWHRPLPHYGPRPVGAGDRQREPEGLLGIGPARSRCRRRRPCRTRGIALLTAVSASNCLVRSAAMTPIALASAALSLPCWSRRRARRPRPCPSASRFRSWSDRRCEPKSTFILAATSACSQPPATRPSMASLAWLDELLGEPRVLRVDRLLVVLVDVADQLGDLGLRSPGRTPPAGSKPFAARSGWAGWHRRRRAPWG